MTTLIDLKGIGGVHIHYITGCVGTLKIQNHQKHLTRKIRKLFPRGKVFKRLIKLELRKLKRDLYGEQKKLKRKSTLNMGDMLAFGGPSGCIKMRT